MTIDETISALEHEFAVFSDWEDRYAHIIAIGKGLAPYPETYRTDEFKVRGCQSQVWLHATIADGVVSYDADSDALIVKGLVAMLMRLYNGRSPEEILVAPADYAGRLGLDKHLSQNRSSGMASIIKQIKLYALAYSMVENT